MRKEQKTPIKEAAALSYHQDTMHAPVVVAKGKGETAEAIINIAKKNQVPIEEDPSLVHLLNQLNVNEQIPEELYQAVAEIFAFIYQADKKVGKNKTIK